MKEHFFFVYREGGWSIDSLKKMAMVYKKRNISVEVVLDQPSLVKINDIFMHTAVPFFKYFIQVRGITFLYPESDGSEKGTFFGYDEERCEVLVELGCPSEFVKKFLKERHLTLKIY